MLVELGLVEQRHAAVLAVLSEGVAVTEVALRYGVTRQTVHRWLRRYAARGLSGLADGSPRPDSCPHQMPAEVEALVVRLRRENPAWGPRTLLFQLEAAGGDVVPWERFGLAAGHRHGEPEPATLEDPSEAPAPVATRKVCAKGKISFASQPYPVGV